MFRIRSKKYIEKLLESNRNLKIENKYLSGFYNAFQKNYDVFPIFFFQLEFKNNQFLIPFSSNNTFNIIACNSTELIRDANLFFDIFSSEDKQILINKFIDNNIQNNFNLEFFVNSSKVCNKYLKIIAYLIHNQDSNVCWNVIVLDISKQKSIEKHLEQSQINLKDLINSSKDFIWSVDKNFKLLTLNDSYFHVFKAQNNIELIQGENIIEQLPVNIRQLWSNRYTRALNGESYVIEEFYNFGKTISFLEISLNPIYNNKEVIGVSVFASDITQKKHVEMELDSLARLPSENPDPIIRVFKDGTVINANESGEELLKSWKSKIGSYIPDDLIINVNNVLDDGQRIEIEENYKGITYSIIFTPVVDKEYVNIYGRDISAKKEAEIALRESEERLRAIFGAANNVSFILTDASNPNPKIVDFSSGAENLFKYTKHELLGKPVSLLFTFSEIKNFPDIHKKLSQGNDGYKAEVQHIRKDGDVFPANFSVFPLFDSKGLMFASLFVSIDITERKNIERTIIKTIIDTEEKERERFANDLHDGLGPLLSSLKLYIKVMSKSINKEKQNIVKDAFEVVDESLKSIKTISNNLSPHILNDFGLYAAINAFVKKINIPEYLRVNLNSNIKQFRFDKNIEIIIYRIAKELINNTLKHASATKIDISLLIKQDILFMEYLDNGIGFDFNYIFNESSKGLGLFSIKNRLESINGNFKIESKIGYGVKVIINVKI